MTAALQTVHVRVNDAGTGQPTPCRVRFTGPDGTYYAPFGRLTEFAANTIPSRTRTRFGQERIAVGLAAAYNDAHA